MKKLSIFFLLILLSCKAPEAVTKDLDPYNKVFNTLVSDQEFKNFIKNESINVSTQVLPFEMLAWLFDDKLKHLNPSYNSNSSSSFDSKNFKDKESLKSLSESLESNYTLFFTETQNGLLLAEIAETKFKTDDYRSATAFGKGLVFLLKIEEDEVVKIHSKVIHHN